MALKWYVARTGPLAEYAARDRLEAAGLEVFLPCARTRAPRPGHEDAPLFPGYLFIRYDLEERGNGPLHQVPQPLKLVSFGGVVPSLPDGVVVELYQRVRAINGRGGLRPRFKPGDRVRVALGPLDSLAEVVEGESPGARVRVLMEFLGRMVEARVPMGSVQQAGVGGYAAQQDGRPSRRTRGRGRWINGFGPRSIRESSGLPDDSNNGRSSS